MRLSGMKRIHEKHLPAIGRKIFNQIRSRYPAYDVGYFQMLEREHPNMTPVHQFRIWPKYQSWNNFKTLVKTDNAECRSFRDSVRELKNEIADFGNGLTFKGFHYQRLKDERKKLRDQMPPPIQIAGSKKVSDSNNRRAPLSPSNGEKASGSGKPGARHF